jgi:glutamyl-tRNA reductase
MTLIVVGLSHRSAPMELLERLYINAEDTAPVLRSLVALPNVDEVVLLSTCNRVEVYASASGFHAGLAEISSVLAGRAGVSAVELADQMYAYHGQGAVRHCMRVAGGLDSMVVGEAQILGQLRDAYAVATEHDTAGQLLHELMQQSLRVGKRVHAETGIDRAGASLVTAALAAGRTALAARPTALAAGHAAAGESQDCADLGSADLGSADLGSADLGSALVIGAGSMGSLAVATLARQGVEQILVANRGAGRAQRLATAYGARAVALAGLESHLATVDIVLCAAAAGTILDAGLVRRARAGTGRPLLVLDLAVPRAVDPAVAALPGVILIDLARLSELLLDQRSTSDYQAADAIVAAEVDAYLSWLRGNDVAPTVAALRTRADAVVAGELARLASRRPDFTDEQRAEIARTAHRIVQQLLHSPTVRVRQLASMPGGGQYTAALRDLFDLRVAVEVYDGTEEDLAG